LYLESILNIFINKHVSYSWVEVYFRNSYIGIEFYLIEVVCHSYVNPLLPIVVASVFHAVILKPCCSRML